MFQAVSKDQLFQLWRFPKIKQLLSEQEIALTLTQQGRYQSCGVSRAIISESEFYWTN